MTTLSFRVTEEEAAQIREYAKRANLTVSAWLRQRIPESLTKDIIQFPNSKIQKMAGK